MKAPPAHNGRYSRINGPFYRDDPISKVGLDSTGVDTGSQLERRKLKRAVSASVKGKPQIEQRQDHRPVSNKAVSLMGAPSAMLCVVAAQTQSLQIPQSAASGSVIGLIAEVVDLERIAAPSPPAAVPAALPISHQSQPPAKLPVSAVQIAVVISPPSMSRNTWCRHQALTNR
jgi:hypothetical protein